MGFQRNSTKRHPSSTTFPSAASPSFCMTLRAPRLLWFYHISVTTPSEAHHFFAYEAGCIAGALVRRGFGIRRHGLKVAWEGSGLCDHYLGLGITILE